MVKNILIKKEMLFREVKSSIFAYYFGIMKHFFGIILLTISLFGCDDGDFNIDTFDFSTVTSASCNSGVSGFFVYKINGSEVLLLQIPENNFINEITPAGEPRTVSISGANKLIYRIYNGTVTSGAICTTIPPANPNVTEEWNAVSGTIEITTTANKTTNETDNSSFVSGYTHSVIIRNVNFEKSNGAQQLYSVLDFGSYITTATPPSNFVDFTLKACDTSFNFVYKVVGIQSLRLTTDGSLFLNEVTPADTPRKALIGSTYQLQLDYYADNINDAFMCASPTPTTPSLLQRWTAQNGVTDVSGIIEVVTTEEYEIPTDNQSPLVGYRQTITLKKVTMERNGVTFKLGDSYALGAIVTPL